MTISAKSHETADTALPNPEAAAATSVWSGHIPALDGIRGLGILLVLVYHYGASAGVFGFSNPLITLSALGWSGVDLFFVLSGFLITGILYDSKGKEKYFRNFYARRTLRIFPLYYAAAFAVILLDAVWRHDLLGGANPLWIVFYVGNFQMALEGGGSILDHFWSLAIEEQFYLIWPMVVLALSRKRLMMVAAAMIIVAPLIRAALVMNDAPSLAVYVLTPARMDSLAMGALIALAIRGPKGIEALIPWAWAAGLTALASFLTIVGVRHTFSSGDPVILTAGLSLLLTFYGSMLILSLTFRPLTRLMELPVMRWFGKYSYGLYVFHPIVNMILLHSPLTDQFGEMNAVKALMLLILAFTVSVVLAILSFRFFESPLLRLKSRFH
ncbi:MAG: acyltransferase family protein [Hyphomonas sp.]